MSNKVDKNVTILINSCDKYEDTWEPFFRLLHINWPECTDYRIVLNSETKQYNCDFLSIDNLCYGRESITWSERLNKVLNDIDTEFVLFFLDDFFLKSRVSNEAFLEAVDYIEKDKSVGYIGLKYNSSHKFKDKNQIEPKDHFFDRTLTDTVNRINCNTALWRKSFLVSLLRKHESPWEFEKYGSYRSQRYNYKIMIINNLNGIMPPVFDYDVEIKYGHGLTLGQWLPKNKELFDKFGIIANFDKLGINYSIYEAAINPPLSTEISKNKENFDLKESLYNLKKKPKKIKKNIVKKIRKIMSLM